MGTLIALVFLLCLFGTVIWAADKYLEIKGTFSWARGLIIFLVIVAMCYFLWETFGHRLEHLRL